MKNETTNWITKEEIFKRGPEADKFLNKCFHAENKAEALEIRTFLERGKTPVAIYDVDTVARMAPLSFNLLVNLICYKKIEIILTGAR